MDDTNFLRNTPIFGSQQQRNSTNSRKRSAQMQNGSQSNISDLKKQRYDLPIFTARQSLIREVRINSNLVIVGETGSGKTTQIPQFLHEAGLSKAGLIGCTQPRRVAAMSVAGRVAKEMGVQLGHQVGYCVRFEDVTTPKTRVKYMTDGMLLRESIGDSLLMKYAVIILDEAHERTVHTDVLFGVVKNAQKLRHQQGQKPLKIVIMSATLEAEHFSKYFENAKVLYIEGRQHPITIMYTQESKSNDYLHAALVTVMQLHQEQPPGGDILVFLTGQDEIESLEKLIKDCAGHCTGDCPELLVCPLFAALPSKLQMRVFTPSLEGTRRVILATNIAETSVTIPGVKYVIDTGFVKAKGFSPKTGLDMLSVQPVSKAQARQRCGRAGRESSGSCYRLYTETQFDEMIDMTVPEIQRCNLASVVLQLLALGIKNILQFDFMDPPSSEALENAVEQLELLKAVEKKENVAQLTKLGQQMVCFPLEPRLAKAILMAKDYECTEEILTVVALLSVDSLLYTPHSMRDVAKKRHAKFMSSEGDHITLLNIYRAYKSVNGNRDWCLENFINMRAMKNVIDIRKQLREICVRQEIPLVSCGKDTSVLRHCLATGLFLQSAELQLDGSFQTIFKRQTVAIHPSSALFNCKPAYIVYNELVHTSKCYMRDVSLVDPDWLVGAAPEFFKEHKIQPNNPSAKV